MPLLVQTAPAAVICRELPNIIARYGELCGSISHRADHFMINVKDTGRLRVHPLTKGRSYVYLYKAGNNYGTGVSGAVPDAEVGTISFILCEAELLKLENGYEYATARLVNFSTKLAVLAGAR